MKNYFLKKEEFGNQYTIFWASEKEIEGCEKITRKEAIDLCRDERQRRKDNPNFAGYASAVILPQGCEFDEREAADRLQTNDGYIYY